MTQVARRISDLLFLGLALSALYSAAFGQFDPTYHRSLAVAATLAGLATSSDSGHSLSLVATDAAAAARSARPASAVRASTSAARASVSVAAAAAAVSAYERSSTASACRRSASLSIQ